MKTEISNGAMSAVISSKGAELVSLKHREKELIWNADPNVWAQHAPVLFPICGGLKEDKYVYGGKEYNLCKHGFGRRSEFELETAAKDSAVFLLKSNEETRKSYPFEFELRVKYHLEPSQLGVEYEVKNIGGDAMYFSIGAHEGYACPEGIEDYSVVFETEEDLVSTVLNGNLLEYKYVTVGRNVRELDLKYDYFAVDALVFTDLKSRSVVLKNRKTNEQIKLSFDGFDYFLLWTKPGAKYICLEPWCGVQDYADSDFDITKKPGINRLEPSEVFSRTHVISI